jgi:gamma-glutamylputrescine oxidase
MYMAHNLSFWETETYFNHIDVVIIGSGIVGLNAALNLKLKSPHLKVIILERGFLPSGASTKNAGFACFGSPSELLDDLKINNEDTVFNLVAKRWQGLQRLRQHLGDDRIDFKPWGGYELFQSDAAYDECAEQLNYLNQRLKCTLNLDSVYATVNEKIHHFGFQQVKHLIVNSAEGQINTGMMMLALTQKVQSLGVVILNSINVTRFESEDHVVHVTTDKDISFKTRKILVAVNGFAQTLLPDCDVFPARAQVLLTTPIAALKLKGTFHFDKGYYYFRNIGDRVLFGGGRNLDFKGEQTPEFGLTDLIQERLQHYLATMILPETNYQIESRWSGIMGLGRTDKTFIVKKIREHVYCAVRMGGMGIAVGSLVGEEAAELILQDR